MYYFITNTIQHIFYVTGIAKYTSHGGNFHAKS